jgi:glycosyltransferase involved in cell wall biosynthesis
MTRSLFCLVCAEIGGGNWVLLKIAQELLELGQEVEIFLWDDRKPIDWHAAGVPISSAETIEEAVSADFDFIYFANAFLVPLALPFIKKARPVLVCQGYESFCYGETYQEALNDSPALMKVMQLPISIISTSRSIEKLVKERTGRDSYLVPVGIERSMFHPHPKPIDDGSPKRILMVGNYLLPWKGMSDGFEAIDLLARELAVQLVLITQAGSGHHVFERFSFSTEKHYRPKLAEVAEIMKTCHVYCCSSWYEGLGLPKLEAFSSGIPVVSTRDFGVSEFGVDGENILLAEPNNPQDLYRQLKRVLTEDSLADRLRTNALQTVQQYEWINTTPAFLQSQLSMQSDPRDRSQVSQAEMQTVCEELEQAGLFTPSETYQTIRKLYRRFSELCTELIDQRIELTDGIHGLSQVGSELAGYLNNPKAQYYKAFKARYDACRLLLSLKDEPKFLDYVKALHKAQ